PWSQNNASFILTCQWDQGAEEPVWTLYEEDTGTSKVLWTQSFPAHEIEFMYDILVMSAPKVADTATSVEDLLKTGGNAEWRFDDEEAASQDYQESSGVQPEAAPAAAAPAPAPQQSPPPQQQ